MLVRSDTRNKHFRFNITGVFHSTKNSEIFETETNGTDISWEKFQKTRKLLNFQRASHLTENSGNSRMKIKWNINFPEMVFRNFGYTSRGYPLFQKLCKFAIFYSELVLLVAILTTSIHGQGSTKKASEERGPNREADQLVSYKRSQEVELGSTAGEIPRFQLVVRTEL